MTIGKRLAKKTRQPAAILSALHSAVRKMAAFNWNDNPAFEPGAVTEGPIILRSPSGKAFTHSVQASAAAESAAGWASNSAVRHEPMP